MAATLSWLAPQASKLSSAHEQEENTEDPRRHLRGRAAPTPGGAGQAAGMDTSDQCPDRGDLRGPGRGGQGRHDQANQRVPQRTGSPGGGAADAHRAGAWPVVLPALHRPPPGPRRDCPVRPLLVQPGRRGKSHGLLHAPGVRALHAAGAPTGAGPSTNRPAPINCRGTRHDIHDISRQ